MAKKQSWQDDYWLLLMQQYLRKPVGMKALYSREMVELSLELHIAPELLHARMKAIDQLATPRIERIWREYSQNPRRLSRAVSLLRSMAGFNSSGDFYDGVAVEETFERDFRPLESDPRLTPVALTLVLDLYFRLTPITMVADTPEVQELARMLRVPVAVVISVLENYQVCDPYLSRRGAAETPLLADCRRVWQQYGNGDTRQLAQHADELKAFYQ